MNDAAHTQTGDDVPAADDTPDRDHSPTEPAPVAPDDIAPPIAAMLASIRAAVVKNPSPEVRAAGAAACRSILTVLEAKPGAPLAVQPAATASPTSPLASLLSQPGILNKLAAMPREQLLDLVKQVVGALPARSQDPATAGPRFHLIQIPQVRRPNGA